MACCKSVPQFKAKKVTVTPTLATIEISGVFPVSGRFDIKVCGNCLDVCSGVPIALTDGAGTTITNIIGKCCGDQILLNKVAVQARRHKWLHFCRSADTPTMVILQDKICAPTPVVTTAAAPASEEAPAAQAASATSASSKKLGAQ